MKKMFFVLIVLVVSLQCMADGGHWKDTIINGMKYEKYYNRTTTSKYEKDEELIIPKSNGNPAIDKIRTFLLGGSVTEDSDWNNIDNAWNLGWPVEETEQVFYGPDSIRIFFYLEDEQEDEQEEFVFHTSYLSVEPIKNVGGFLSMKMTQSDSYNTAAHPNWYVRHAAFSLKTGLRISQEDIFLDSEEVRTTVDNKLGELLAEYLNDGMPSASGISMLNDNFYIDKNELVYCYSPYEVAYYAAGAPELKLSKNWLKPYMKKDSELYKYWFGGK